MDTIMPCQIVLIVGGIHNGTINGQLEHHVVGNFDWILK